MRGGEFFTPSDVSELLTRLGTVGKTKVNKVYDPACGSGSLLLKARKVLGKDGVQRGYYGQEINITTYNLCRIPKVSMLWPWTAPRFIPATPLSSFTSFSLRLGTVARHDVLPLYLGKPYGVHKRR